MHATAMSFVDNQLRAYVKANVSTITNTVGEVRGWSGMTRLVEFGAQNVNGTIRDLDVLRTPSGLFYLGVDLALGEGVNLVADCRDVTVNDVGGPAHIVVCTNVLEHEQAWPDIIAAAYRILVPGGWFIVQCAGPGFQVHSGRSESLTLEPGEYYGNVDHNDLRTVMVDAGFDTVRTWYREQWPHDTTGTGIK